MFAGFVDKTCIESNRIALADVRGYQRLIEREKFKPALKLPAETLFA